MNTDILTLQLPTDVISFLRKYAERHKITISELIDRYAGYLQVSQKCDIHPEYIKLPELFRKILMSAKFQSIVRRLKKKSCIVFGKYDTGVQIVFLICCQLEGRE